MVYWQFLNRDPNAASQNSLQVFVFFNYFFKNYFISVGGYIIVDIVSWQKQKREGNRKNWMSTNQPVTKLLSAESMTCKASEGRGLGQLPELSSLL